MFESRAALSISRDSVKAQTHAILKASAAAERRLRKSQSAPQAKHAWSVPLGTNNDHHHHHRYYPVFHLQRPAAMELAPLSRQVLQRDPLRFHVHLACPDSLELLLGHEDPYLCASAMETGECCSVGR